MENQYRLLFENHSTNWGNVCLYQTPPKPDENIFSLAWFAEPCHPTTTSTFTWNLDYDFFWDITGELVPGVMLNSSQKCPANLNEENCITLSYENNAYTFKNLISNGKPGKFEIIEDSTIPLNQAAVGLAMAGSGTLVRQTQPNKHLFFTPHPKYWICFGNYERGQVLDIMEMTDSQQIVFPTDIHTIKVTLHRNNTWSVVPYIFG